LGELRSVQLEHLPMLDFEERGERGTIVFDTGEDPGPWRQKGAGLLQRVRAMPRGRTFSC
jgi:hypothetical protein